MAARDVESKVVFTAILPTMSLIHVEMINFLQKFMEVPWRIVFLLHRY